MAVAAAAALLEPEKYVRLAPSGDRLYDRYTKAGLADTLPRPNGLLRRLPPGPDRVQLTVG